jgi:DNA-binding LytR/AlgR family response regulator
MKVLLIEDEPLAAERLRQLLHELRPSWTLVGPATSLREASMLLQAGSFDLALCDIRLTDGLSLQLFEQGLMVCPVIFTTAYDQYAVQAFRRQALDYLLKPLEAAELEEALRRFEQQPPKLVSADHVRELLQPAKSYKERFIVKVGDKLKSFGVDEVSLLFSADKLCWLRSGDRNYPIDFTLDQLEDQLDPKRFFRISRKYIVHISAITEIHSWFNSRWKLSVRDCDDDELVVAREKAAEFKRWLDQ